MDTITTIGIRKGDVIIRARACIKCREYVVIHPDNPINKELVGTFEADHRGHTIVTLDLNEIKGLYKNTAHKNRSASIET